MCELFLLSLVLKLKVAKHLTGGACDRSPVCFMPEPKTGTAAAHLSSTTQKSLESMGQRKTGRMAKGTTPTDFINGNCNGTVYWYYYKDLLDATAENIANGNV